MDIINIFMIQFWCMVVGHFIASYYILLAYSFIWSDVQKTMKMQPKTDDGHSSTVRTLRALYDWSTLQNCKAQMH